MEAYLRLAREILQEGVEKKDRTATGTVGIFGYQMKFDLQKGFPLLTTKKLHLASIIHELLWFLKGETNINYLKERKVSIWDQWADRDGNLGPVYGFQWRKWPGEKEPIDQIKNVIEQIKSNPNSRRLIVSAWNVGMIDKMALPPCHLLFQFYVANHTLSLQLYQRSADVFLGLPFNIASYSLLLMMIAQVCQLKVGKFVHTLGDAHIYKNHIEQINLQLTRVPRSLPSMILSPRVENIFDFHFDDFKLENYSPSPPIRGIVSV